MTVYLKDIPLGASVRLPGAFSSYPSLVVDVLALDGYGSAMLGKKERPENLTGYLFELDVSEFTEQKFSARLGINKKAKVVDNLREYRWFAGWYAGAYKAELVNRIVDPNKKCSACGCPIPHSEQVACAFCEVDKSL